MCGGAYRRSRRSALCGARARRGAAAQANSLGIRNRAPAKPAIQRGARSRAQRGLPPESKVYLEGAGWARGKNGFRKENAAPVTTAGTQPCSGQALQAAHPCRQKRQQRSRQKRQKQPPTPAKAAGAPPAEARPCCRAARGAGNALREGRCRAKNGGASRQSTRPQQAVRPWSERSAADQERRGEPPVDETPAGRQAHLLAGSP